VTTNLETPCRFLFAIAVNSISLTTYRLSHEGPSVLGRLMIYTRRSRVTGIKSLPKGPKGQPPSTQLSIPECIYYFSLPRLGGAGE
jgi:hypothetical protein